MDEATDILWAFLGCSSELWGDKEPARWAAAYIWDLPCSSCYTEVQQGSAICVKDPHMTKPAKGDKNQEEKQSPLGHLPAESISEAQAEAQPEV